MNGSSKEAADAPDHYLHQEPSPGEFGTSQDYLSLGFLAVWEDEGVQDKGEDHVDEEVEDGDGHVHFVLEVQASGVDELHEAWKGGEHNITIDEHDDQVPPHRMPVDEVVESALDSFFVFPVDYAFVYGANKSKSYKSQKIVVGVDIFDCWEEVFIFGCSIMNLADVVVGLGVFLES